MGYIKRFHQCSSFLTACLPAGVINASKAHNNANHLTQEAGEELWFLMFAPSCLVAIVSSQSAVVLVSQTRGRPLGNPDDASLSTDSKGREIRLILSLSVKVDVLAIESCFCLSRAGFPAPPKPVTPQVRNNTFYLVVKPSCCSYSLHPSITYTSKCLPTSRRKQRSLSMPHQDH